MKRTLAVLAIIVGVLVAAFAVTAPFHVGYYADWNGLLREIRERPGLEAIDGWRNEDMSLEEMGFTIRSARATLSLFLSERGARRARDGIDGISMPTGQRQRDGNLIRGVNGYIRFDSDEWKQRGLPRVRTLGDVLDHFDAIAHSLVTHPPTVIGVHAPGDYLSLGPPFRAPPADRGPPRPVEDSSRWIDRWLRQFR